MLVLVPLIKVLSYALDIYWWMVIIYVIMSWLVSFRVINTQNQFVRMVWEFLWRVTDPVLKRIRRFMPSLGGMDISPIVLFLVIIFIQLVLQEILFSLARGAA